MYTALASCSSHREDSTHCMALVSIKSSNQRVALSASAAANGESSRPQSSFEERELDYRLPPLSLPLLNLVTSRRATLFQCATRDFDNSIIILFVPIFYNYTPAFSKPCSCPLYSTHPPFFSHQFREQQLSS